MNATRVMKASMAVCAFLLAAGAKAQTKTFTGAGNWTTAANWSPGVPADGDDVVIDGICTNTASTENLNSYTLNAARTHVFSGTTTFLRAATVTINGTLTHPANTATAPDLSGDWIPDNLLQIVAATDVTVGTTGKINVDGKGYQSARGKPGYGPGGGKYNGIGGGGAGYGGNGAESRPEFVTADGGLAYGVATAPVEPGSGGANSAFNFGGGAVRIDAGGVVTVNGSISANGSFVSEDSSAGASGGSVYITCGAIDGSGLISAKASDASRRSFTGGGGGGRIAVVYTNTTLQATLTPAVQFTTEGGLSTYDPPGEHGTVYLPDASFYPYSTLVGCGRLLIPGFTSWAPDSLTVTAGTLQLPDGFDLSVGNDLILKDSGNLDLRRFESLVVGGNAMVTNGGALHVRGAPTNGVSPIYASVVTITGSLTVAANSFVYPWSDATNGGSVMITAASVTVAANGQINADGKGFGGGPKTDGFGPGGGRITSYYAGGGGYGGKGGRNNPAYTAGSDGPAYGVAEAPEGPGSGGGGFNSAPYFRVGRAGGGLVRIQTAGRVTVDGTISANGESGNSYTGGGSGGGVYIACASFSGKGRLQANGGNSGNECGGGGGGRIAVVYTNPVAQERQVPVVFTTTPGLGHGGIPVCRGQVGTLYLPDTTFLPTNTVTGVYRLSIPGFTAWAPTDLIITNAEIEFPPDFTFDVANTVTIGASASFAFSNGVMRCGDLSLTNSGKLHVYGGLTNGMEGSYGATVEARNALSLWPGSTAYIHAHPGNGGAVLLTAKRIRVATGAAIDGSGLGYLAANAAMGAGPGGWAARNGAGGSYGGLGGKGWAGSVVAPVYGDAQRPLDPGSAGCGNGADYGGAGGSAIRIETPRSGSVTLDGSVMANGLSGINNTGGGAGGSVFISCGTLAGDGEIQATGAKGMNEGGGGGGGRIAVACQHIEAWSGYPASAADMLAVTGGVGRADFFPARWGQSGTIYFGEMYVPNGTVMLIR